MIRTYHNHSFERRMKIKVAPMEKGDGERVRVIRIGSHLPLRLARNSFVVSQMTF